MFTKMSAGRVRQIYKFIELHKGEYSVQTMCRVLEVAPSGYYAWLQQPICSRAMEDARLLRLIRKSFVASHGIYGAPRVFLDLREAGETCSKHRIARLMRQNNLYALHGYRTRRVPAGRSSIQIPSLLQRQFTDYAAKQSLGYRHNLCADLAGLALLGGSDGLVLTKNRRLGY